ncbi:helix-turn-helix transcriptional regulator [Gordonia sp. NB41Y]|uniref:helix-turn-helix domain-containing protein n=1 Tax=Gordonia sp. NB41Y TaxID=875808 RepID=UPI0002C03A08|nr:helix-turn-helix transcriptional regulator [Gordonia sp. NB41Y]EMP14408.1 XRE family transcriptional regulator [Gordonia sp. NB41Y]WLP91683.1 helix-turn-helix transcriptional regulator [Gordonia sp. NB41Y]
MPARERGSLEWDTYGDSFGHRLAYVRGLRGLSQEALAQRCGMHRNQISNLERNTSNRDPFIADPQLSTVYRLAYALEVAPRLLIPDGDVLVKRRSPEQSTRAAYSRVEAELERLLGALDDDSH